MKFQIEIPLSPAEEKQFLKGLVMIKLPVLSMNLEEIGDDNAAIITYCQEVLTTCLAKLEKICTPIEYDLFLVEVENLRKAITDKEMQKNVAILSKDITSRVNHQVAQN